MNILELAQNASRLLEEADSLKRVLDETPVDRGGKDGPRGRASIAFHEASKAAHAAVLMCLETIDRDMLSVMSALEFYADPESWEPSVIQHLNSCSLGDSPADDDRGDRARAALFADESRTSDVSSSIAAFLKERDEALGSTEQHTDAERIESAKIIASLLKEEGML